MSKDNRISGLDEEKNISLFRYILALLMRNSITTALVFLLLLPILNLLPEDLYNFTFDHPFLLLGPLLILVPVVSAYFVNWKQIMAPENLAIPIGLLFFGLIYSMTVYPFGLMTGLFICPDEYPITDLSNFGRVAKHKFSGEWVRVICVGKSGIHEIPGTILSWVTTAAFLLSGVLSAGVSFIFGRRSWLLSRKSDAGEFHFIRYFLIAMTLSMGFLALPEYYSGANFLADRYESSGRKRPFKGGQIGRYSPIHGAVLSGDLALAKNLLGEGANVNALINQELTPLAIAVKRKDFRMVRMLVEAGADVNLGEKFQVSAMQRAFQGQNPELIPYLLRNGGNPLAVAKGGYGLLTSAVENLDLEAAGKLLGEGANPNIRTPYRDQSLLVRTIFEVNTDYYQQPRGGQIKSIKMARLLLKHGAKLESREGDGWTPLVFAIREDNIWMVKLFLAKGAKIDALDKYGRNPLYHALKGRDFRKEILALLMDKGVKINHQDLQGETALIAFTQSERGTRALKWLLRNGADVNLVDKSGQTALDKLGNDNNDDKKRELLLDAGAKSARTR